MPQNVTTSQPLRWWAACFLTVVLASGCAHRATTIVWKPAEFDLSEMETLAVAGFTGHGGDAVVAALHSRLWNSEFYSLVDRRPFDSIRPVAGASDVTGMLAMDDLSAARNAGIDGIILGDVIEYRCDDSPASQQERFREWLPQFGDAPDASEQDGGFAADPKKRTARVTIAFRLVDAETGKIRVSEQISHSSTHRLNNGPHSSPSEAEVLKTLTRRCVDDFVCLLAPHQNKQQIELAKPELFQAGYSLVHNGNEFAVRGRWDEAITTWGHALATNPENDAALFNLAIAHANRQNFTTAETYAIRAMNVCQKEKYQAGLERIRRQSAAYDQILRQRRDVRASGEW